MIILSIMVVTFFSHVVANTTSIPIPVGSTLNFTVNLNNVQEARASNNNLMTRPNSNAPLSESPLLDRLTSVWIDPSTKQTLPNRLSKSTGSFLNDYKWPLLAGLFATGYGYLFYIIASGNSFFSQKDLWSSWRQDLTLEQLLSIPQAQFARELLQEIQRRYTDPAAITDIVRPLGMFMKKIEEEEQALLWYQTSFTRIEYLKLKVIIPLNMAQFEKISERLQRIAYLKNAFHTWAAQYQLEQASKSYKNPIDIPDVTQTAALMAYHYKIALLNYLAQRQLRVTPIH